MSDRVEEKRRKEKICKHLFQPSMFAPQLDKVQLRLGENYDEITLDGCIGYEIPADLHGQYCK